MITFSNRHINSTHNSYLWQMLSFRDVIMTYDEVIWQRFILCCEVDKNSCFLLLNDERTLAYYRLIIKTLRKLKMWKSLVVTVSIPGGASRVTKQLAS